MDLDELLEEFNASKNMGQKPPPKDWDTSSPKVPRALVAASSIASNK
jgi:hypothetical protein